MTNNFNQEDIDQFREDLIEEVGSQAVWRDGKAIEYPGDRQRNEQSAAALRALCENLEKIPVDHPLWARLANVYRGPGAPEVVSEDYRQAEQEQLRAYGFHGPENGGALAFLEAYVRELEGFGRDVHDEHERAQ